MSVIVMTRVPGQITDFERVVKENSDTFVSVSQAGKAAGAVHHCFVEDTDGSVMIIDEWDSEESFQAFFTSQEEIPKLMAAAGVTGPPVTTSYRIIDTPDRF
jgi:heme-degrading monooxygenase HmoA